MQNTHPLPAGLARHPATISINVDIEAVDALGAGEAGLFGKFSYGRYGLREGLPRLLALLRQTGIRATFFVVPADALRHPRMLEALAADGHEIAVQTSIWLPAHPTEGSEDLDSLAQACETLRGLTGQAPLGWRAANGIVTTGALRRLAELGMTYDSSFLDDDLPYVMGEGAARLVELPVFDYLNDSIFYGGRHPTDRVAKVWQEETTAMLEAGAYLHLVLHSRGDVGTAREIRVDVLARWLERTAALPGVAFYRCCDLARIWLEGTPAEAVEAFAS
ncbi:polysaccharide deacetylase family protein [Xylophilus rhododendri]|uniref:Polysaccharide deacetylase family protein n=1 Tax=Xylophilus rhododendri TaxID=2697032 RepID=A0A857J4S0_9BURK|nr:polysaccharide deacetylase family protein [Xylophilus rhododendri]QHI98964.1 polysaccharide deacetylase family protein [Xylophilus rhododendri]